jgi:hypothetical protein
VASPDGTVRACPSRQDAEIDAGLAGNLTIASVGDPVWPLVYYHPDGRWVYADTGFPV